MKLFIPLVLLSLILLHLNKIKINTSSIVAALIIVCALTGALYGTIYQNGGQRFYEISIFSNEHNSIAVNTHRHISNLSYNDFSGLGEDVRIIDRLIYNKPSILLDLMTQNYLKVFSLDFLFVNGDPNQRHSASNFGELYRIEVISVLLGLIFITLNIKKFSLQSKILLAWILLAPLPAIITQEGSNHATRLFMLFPPLTILSALGIYFLNSLLSPRIKTPFMVIFALFWLYCVVTYLNYYFGSYNIESAKAFQFRFNEAAQTAFENKSNYEYVIIDDKTDSALMNYLFVSSYDPANFQELTKAGSLTQEIDKNFRAYKLDNVYLMQPRARNWDEAFALNQFNFNYLLIVTPEQMNEEDPQKINLKLTRNQNLKKTIYYKSGLPAFYVIESKKP